MAVIVRTLETIMTPGGEVPPGKVISIPDEVCGRLQGKVESIRLPAYESAQACEKLEMGEGRPQGSFTTTAFLEITHQGIVHATPPLCRWCRGIELWRTVRGDAHCRNCHPPAPGAEVVAGGLT